MITGIDLDYSVDYTLSKDKENPTVWKIGVIPSSLYARIIGDDIGSDKLYKLVSVCLKGISNSEIKYKTVEVYMFGRKVNAVPFDVLDKIDQSDIAELAAKCIDVNKGLSKDEEKNS